MIELSFTIDEDDIAETDLRMIPRRTPSVLRHFT